MLQSAALPPPRRVAVVAAPESVPPFAVAAVVAEEDTYLVLSAGAEITGPDPARLRVFHEAYTAEPMEPGSVVVRTGTPLRLLAVVHDLSAVPTWREEWVDAALAAVMRETGRRRLRSLALPLLGRVHGDQSPEAFVRALWDALERAGPRSLERLWLVTPEGDLEEVRALLASGLLA